MDAVAKTAQAGAFEDQGAGEERTAEAGETTPADAPKPAQPVKEGLRDGALLRRACAAVTTATESDEEEDILAETAEDEPTHENPTTTRPLKRPFFLPSGFGWNPYYVERADRNCKA